MGWEKCVKDCTTESSSPPESAKRVSGGTHCNTEREGGQTVTFESGQSNVAATITELQTKSVHAGLFTYLKDDQF